MIVLENTEQYYSHQVSNCSTTSASSASSAVHHLPYCTAVTVFCTLGLLVAPSLPGPVCLSSSQLSVHNFDRQHAAATSRAKNGQQFKSGLHVELQRLSRIFPLPQSAGWKQ